MKFSFDNFLAYLESGYTTPRLCALFTGNNWHKCSKALSSASQMFAAPGYAWPRILSLHLQEHRTIRGHGTMILPQATHFLHIESSAKPLRVGASSGCCKPPPSSPHSSLDPVTSYCVSHQSTLSVDDIPSPTENLANLRECSCNTFPSTHI